MGAVLEFLSRGLIIGFIFFLSVVPTIAVISMLYRIYINTQPLAGPNLEPCPDCGRAVSRSALFCPHCGRPSTSPLQDHTTTVA